MMINKILKYYYDQGVRELVESQLDPKQCLNSKTVDLYNKINIKDVRSATFYSLGKAKMLQNPVILIVDENYISSCYSGLTEAWFQRQPIILISYGINNNKYLSHLERCLDRIIYYSDNILNEISEVKDIKGPILICVEEKNTYDLEIDYTQPLLKLNEFLDINDSVYCYNSMTSDTVYKFKLHNIIPKNKYGIFSKYLGWSLGDDHYTVLCCPDYLMDIDMNIFNNNNINRKFKIIIFGTSINYFLKRKSSWISANNINVEYYNDFKKPNYKNFIENSSATVIFIENK